MTPIDIVPGQVWTNKQNGLKRRIVETDFSHGDEQNNKIHWEPIEDPGKIKVCSQRHILEKFELFTIPEMVRNYLMDIMAYGLGTSLEELTKIKNRQKINDKKPTVAQANRAESRLQELRVMSDALVDNPYLLISIKKSK